MGDFNSNHSVWGCDTIGFNGKKLYNYFQHNNLVDRNNGEPTVFSMPHQRKSAIDFIIVPDSIALKCKGLKINDSGFSDHFPTVCVLDTGPSVAFMSITSNRWNYKLADWTKYGDIIDKH